MDTISAPDMETMTGLLNEAYRSVCQTMLQTEIVAHGLVDLDDPNDLSPFYQIGLTDPLVVGSAGFTGEANGVMYQYYTSELALQVASQMTGLDTEDILDEGEDEIVNDVIGELTNMVVGSFKNSLCNMGWDCRITLPTILRGSGLRVNSIESADRGVFRFDLFGMPMAADLFIESFE